MNAQQICDEIDALFVSGRPQEETLADMRQIADRASMFAALPANAEEELSDCYEIEE